MRYVLFCGGDSNMNTRELLKHYQEYQEKMRNASLLDQKRNRKELE